MQTILGELLSESTVVGLKINMNKSKVMMNTHVKNVFFSLRDVALEEVTEYNYLGQMTIVTPGTREKSGAAYIGMGREHSASTLK